MRSHAKDSDLPAHIVRLRNVERVELIMSFYRGLKEFRDLARRSRSLGQRFRFDDIDHLIEEHLRPVKDSCHRLFRQSRRGEADRLLQALFDMYFGILFHIVLKAKENIRLRENYNIRRLEALMEGLRATRRVSALPPGVSRLFDRITGEFERDSAELEGEIARARFMFSQLEKIFNHVIQVYSDNATIIRSLYCQKDFFDELFPKQGLDRLFARIYPRNGPAEAYLMLAFDFLRSGHTSHAEQAFALALKSARTRRIPTSRLRRLYNHYRDQALSRLGDHSEWMLAFRRRLREIESRPAFRLFVSEEPVDTKRAGTLERVRVAAASLPTPD